MYATYVVIAAPVSAIVGGSAAVLVAVAHEVVSTFYVASGPTESLWTDRGSVGIT